MAKAAQPAPCNMRTFGNVKIGRDGLLTSAWVAVTDRVGGKMIYERAMKNIKFRRERGLGANECMHK